MINLKTLTIQEARRLLDEKEVSVQALLDMYLAKIEECNPEINAYLEVFTRSEDIIRAQKMIDEGKAVSLTGIPIAIKDNILIKDEKSSASSEILKDYVAPYDATVITKLKEEGAIFIGRVNMDEFAQGGSTENSAFGVTKNPCDTRRVSGGSSGGSAAAVSMNSALVALGSDTGGSIRQPASFCGVVGLKPTYGSVSRHGLIAMASSLDVIGPITKNVADAQIVFDAIKGIDLLDSTTSEPTKPEEEKDPQNNKTMTDTKDVYTIGVPRAFIEKGIDADVKEIFEASLAKLESAGHIIIDIEIPLFKYTLPVYYILMPAEVSSNMSRYDGVRYGGLIEGNDLQEDYMKTRGGLIGDEVKRRILLGTYVLSSGYYDAYYNKAWQVRKKITENILKVFEKVDLIAMPTTPSPAFMIGEKSKDPLAMYLEDIFTVGANITGVPAISIPAGDIKIDGKSLSVGLQLIAPHHKEEWLFDCGKKFEIL